MNEYEQRINEIIARYGMLPDTTAGLMSQDTKILEQLAKEKGIVIWGAGQGDEERSIAAQILKIYGTYLQNVHYIIDRDPKLQGGKFMGIPIISPEEAGGHKEFRYVIPASGVRRRGQLKQQCAETLPWCKIVEVVPHYEKEFYYLLNHKRIDYETEADHDKKALCLKSLIKGYLYIRDIPYALNYIDEYILAGYEESRQMADFRRELLALVEEMRQKAASREGDVLFYMIDTLRHDKMSDGEGFHMFSYLKDRAYTFENACSAGFYTYEAMCGVILGKMPYEAKVYEHDLSYRLEDCSWLYRYYQNGYRIKIYSNQSYAMFQDSRIDYYESDYMTDKLWQGLCDLCTVKEPMCLIQYCFEAHGPFLTGFSSLSSKEAVRQVYDVKIWGEGSRYDETLRYIDKEFEYYYKLLPQHMKMVIFSDHGTILGGDKSTAGLPRETVFMNPKGNTDVALWIVGGGVTGEYTKPFSMKDFEKAVEPLLNGRLPELPERRYLNAQLYPFHNRSILKEMRENGREKYACGVNYFYGRDYVYVRTAVDGQLYRYGDYENSLADTEEGKRVIEEIRAEYPDMEVPEDLTELSW